MWARMPTKPTAVLAFAPGLELVLLPPAQMERLRSLVELPDAVPLTTFDDDRARSLLAEAEILFAGWLCPVIDTAVLALAPKLRLIAYAAGSVKEFATPAIWERGVRLTTAVAANAIPVAEFTLAAILLANKGAFWSDHRFHADGSGAAMVGWDVGNFGKQVGIIGASHVGRLVMEYLRPFDLDVVVYDPYLTEETALEFDARKVDLETLLRQSDVVSIHAPLLPETVGMIGARELAIMRDGATLINTARGQIVDTPALEAQIASGRLHAVIDTPEPEPLPDTSLLRGNANVFLTPHIAGSMGVEIRRLAEYAMDEIERWIRGEPLRYEVRPEHLERIA